MIILPEKYKAWLINLPNDRRGSCQELKDGSLDAIFLALIDLQVGRGGLCLEPVPLDGVLEVDGGY